MDQPWKFTKGEEIANAITHGVGMLFSIAALVLLIVFSSINGNMWHIVSFTIFGSSMLLMYTSSTMLHSLPEGRAKEVFEIIDHSSIYFFIAGSYTPFLFLVVDAPLRWILFVLVWTLAIGGAIFKSYFVKKYVLASTLLYVVMGWMIVLAWQPLATNLETNGLILLVVGGILYTVGSIFYVWRGFKYHHAIWHLFVIGGSGTHFFAVLLYLL